MIGRSVVICGGLALGFASALVSSGATLDFARPIQILAPTLIPAPPKPVKVAALAPVAPMQSTLAADERIDRLPYDVLIEQAEASGPGNPDDILEFGPMRVRRHIVQTILKAARATDTDPVLLMAIADKESSFSTGVQARTSSATGLYQFIESTWLKVVDEFGAKHGLVKEAEAITWQDGDITVADASERARILELRRDPYLSALMAAEMLDRDRNRIARAIGRDLTDGEVYLAHFLGPYDAERFMQKVVGEPTSAAAKLLPKPARANASLFYAKVGRKKKNLSVAEVHRKFEDMMGTRLDRYRNVSRVSGAMAFADDDTALSATP